MVGIIPAISKYILFLRLRARGAADQARQVSAALYVASVCRVVLPLHSCLGLTLPSAGLSFTPPPPPNRREYALRETSVEGHDAPRLAHCAVARPWRFREALTSGAVGGLGSAIGSTILERRIARGKHTSQRHAGECR